ncbi:MAG: B12-binding domain-containing radical SAM protein [Desulfobacterales bacterium]|nr:B12-binding domain-containing radical SAM protein [Desulfobacterales bacterium]
MPHHKNKIAKESIMYKIALLEPSSDIKGCYVHAGHNEFEPIALGYIASDLETKGFKVEIFRQGLLSVDQIIDHIKRYSPSILGLSVMTHAANSAIKIAKKAKEAIPGIYVIAGGYHPSGDINFVLNKHIDFSVIGEGERTFSELANRLLKNQNADFKEIKGICFAVDENKTIFTGNAERITKEELDAMPFPKRSRDIISKAKMHALMYPPPNKQHNVVTLLSSRGCSNNCQFCCSSAVWGREVVFRNPKKVAEELKLVVDEFGTNAFFFSDLTFNSNKKHVIALCSELAKLKETPHWYAMCTATHLDEETIRAMREAGCRKVGFGVESLSNDNLKKINKLAISAQERTRGIMECCDENGILIKAYMIIGYPWETHDSLTEFHDNIITLPADEIRISYFTPFPGSPAYKKHEDILTTNDWSKFNAIKDVVVENENGVTVDRLAKARIDAFKKFYSDNARQERIAKKIEKFPEFKESFEEFETFLRDAKVIQ